MIVQSINASSLLTLKGDLTLETKHQTRSTKDKAGHIPVIRPLFLLETSFLSSKVFRKPSSPCTRVRLAKFRKSLERVPTETMAKEEAARHGRVGDGSFSSAPIKNSKGRNELEEESDAAQYIEFGREGFGCLFWS